jgi:hypothetical protein
MEYSPADYTNFCAITSYFKSNKSKDVRNYSSLYNSMFNDHRQSEVRVLEFESSKESENIKIGGSLQAWSVFLSNSEVVGLYDNKDVLFNNEKIKSFYCENLSQECLNKLWEELDDNFDLIIDSNDTCFNDKVLFFQRSLSHLTLNGFFIIENLREEDAEDINRQLSDWKDRYPNCEYFYEIVENPINKTFNPVIIVQKLSEL